MTGIIGASRGLDFNLSDDLDMLNKKVGLNTGNLVFQYATGKIIKGDVFDVGINTTWNPREIRERCDKIVFPCANFINPDTDFDNLANYLISLKLPVVALGLGAQSIDYNTDSIPLKKGTEKLIRFLAESSEVIGVRGEYTGKILDSMGIHNHLVTGCPSNLITPTKELEESFKHKLGQPIERITVNGHNPWAQDEKVKQIESLLFKLAVENRGDYLAQSHDPLLRLASGHRFCDHQQWESDLKSLYHASGLDIGIPSFSEFVRKRFYFDIQVPAWLNRSSFYDFSIGLRLHGNMVAFQAGTPTMWITHDSRTSELVDFMQLPKISYEELVQIEQIETLKEVFAGQLAPYFEKRTEIEHSVNRFLATNNLESALSPT